MALEVLLDPFDSPALPADRADRGHTTDPQPHPATKHAKVLAAIGDDPGHFRFYLGLCQASSSKRAASGSDGRDHQRRRLESPSDLIDDAASSTRRP
ncbi:Hypothetical protein PHPALM_36586 [Phytophthora palmivora]|uniref:Uncharacterized protein n=1 Tax=Phytophthora palmivora TaxID=4796 RepID=A0A2P4WZL1_9STRA|nr:Hypothetical protein PHPALM_36586 [Phytophthora palmivora]